MTSDAGPSNPDVVADRHHIAKTIGLGTAAISIAPLVRRQASGWPAHNVQFGADNAAGDAFWRHLGAMGDARIPEFIPRWRYGEGGAERASYAMFLVELLDLLKLPHPDRADARHQFNDYVFERVVRTVDPDGYVRNGRIDLYRRGCLVRSA